QASGTCSATQAATTATSSSTGVPASTGIGWGSALIPTSPARELGWALLPEGPQALAEVLAPRRELEGQGLVLQLGVELGSRARSQQPLGEPERHRRAGGQLIGH